MFDKMKDLFSMQKKAKELKSELANTTIETQRLEGKIKMVFDGKQDIKSLSINDGLLKPENKNILEENLKACINEASDKAKRIMMDKMREQMGGLNLPGMGL